MKKLLITLMVLTCSSFVWAKEASWYETTKDSHIFIKKNSAILNKENPNIKTVIMVVNIPSFKDRHADPSKTVLTNATSISYVSELSINCINKTSKIGKQTLHEGYFGKGKILEEQEADPTLPFTAIDTTPGGDAMAAWEITCKTQAND